jgi:hypothetical protein
MLEEHFGAAFFVTELLTLGAADFALHTAFVKVLEQVASALIQIQAMKIILASLSKTVEGAGAGRYRPQLEILPLLACDLGRHQREEVVEFLGFVG